MTYVILGLLWWGIGIRWWWRAFPARFPDLIDDPVLLLVTFVVYPVFGPVLWLIVKPEEYKGP